MKIRFKRTAAVLSAAMLMSMGQTFLPQTYQPAGTSVTAFAAEEDYPWSDYLKKSADWFGSQEALTVADACIQRQVQGEGGWQKGMMTDHTGDWAHSTIDNDATTSQIRFLMRAYQQTKQQKYFDCAMRGVDCLFKMQYSNGGWMQCLNTSGTYHAHITLNDGAYLHVLSIMKEMSQKTGDFTAVSDAYAQKAAASLEKGIQCLLNMQIVNNGVKTAWCQQHDENTLAPAAARAYELPSTCTSESAGVIQFLYKEAQETGRSDLIESVNAAIKWFQKVQLNGIEFVKSGDDKIVRDNPNASPLWARFYELNTDRPLFSDRDSSVHYNVAEISQERRTGYAWYGNWGKNVVNLPLLQDTGEPQQTTAAQPAEPYVIDGKYLSVKVLDTKNGANWSISDGLHVGDQIFGDRAYTVDNATAVYTTEDRLIYPGETVHTACDSKSYSGDLAEITVKSALTDDYYAVPTVFVDERVISSMSEEELQASWLGDYRNTNFKVQSSNGEVFVGFQYWKLSAVNSRLRGLCAGETVTLGSNLTAKNCVNYFVHFDYLPIPKMTTAPEQGTGNDTTTTTTETTTQTTTTVTATTTLTENTPAPVMRLSGDADCSGTVDISDAVLIARFAAEDKTASITDQGLRNADCDGVKGVDTGDTTMVLRYIARLITEFPV